MAQAIACDLCGQETAVMLETRIETGEVIAVGMSCLIPFYVGAVGSLYDALDAVDAVAFGPAVLALAEKWAPAGHTLEAGYWDERPSAESPGPDNDEPGVSGGGVPFPPLTALAGTEDASVSGEGITVTPDTPARRARNRARTPK